MRALKNSRAWAGARAAKDESLVAGAAGAVDRAGAVSGRVQPTTARRTKSARTKPRGLAGWPRGAAGWSPDWPAQHRQRVARGADGIRLGSRWPITPDSRWRNRAEFLQGRSAIEAFLTRKWQRELDYRLIKQVWAFHENRIAVRFAYEWHDDSSNWFRSYRQAAKSLAELELGDLAPPDVLLSHLGDCPTSAQRMVGAAGFEPATPRPPV
jgi:hypothetical protein